MLEHSRAPKGLHQLAMPGCDGLEILAIPKITCIGCAQLNDCVQLQILAMSHSSHVYRA